MDSSPEGRTTEENWQLLKNGLQDITGKNVPTKTIEVQSMHRGSLKRIKSYAERRNAITSIRLRRKAVTTGTNTWKSSAKLKEH